MATQTVLYVAGRTTDSVRTLFPPTKFCSASRIFRLIGAMTNFCCSTRVKALGMIMTEVVQRAARIIVIFASRPHELPVWPVISSLSLCVSTLQCSHSASMSCCFRPPCWVPWSRHNLDTAKKRAEDRRKSFNIAWIRTILKDNVLLPEGFYREYLSRRKKGKE